MLYVNDCIHILKDLPASSVDMIYLDPPFFTQKNQSLSSFDGKTYAFSDIWESRSAYVGYMKDRIVEMRRVLKDTGSIFLHCDSSASHYLRFLLDEIFGEKNFRSEIIWSYKRWSNSQKGLLPAHQTILYYSKTSEFKFHTVYGEYSPTTNLDQILQERVRNGSGKAVYKRNAAGEQVLGKEKKGVPMSDVWEIPFLNPKAKERNGYPTQKPIELLDRIIQISTDAGDCVLDPFCGSGTTLVSAKLQNRSYIGIDINPEAIELCKKRLDAPAKTTSALLRIGSDAYRTKAEEELSLLKQFDCNIVQRNSGIDAFLKKHYNNAPVAIRIHRSGEPFLLAAEALENAAKKKKCSYSILITHDADWKKQAALLPSNMIVLTKYDALLEAAISESDKSGQISAMQ